MSMAAQPENAGGHQGLDSLGKIYAAQKVTTLISRAWNLLRVNLKSSVLVMLIPTLVLTVFHIVISIPASQTFLTPTAMARLAIGATTALLGLGLGIVSFFVWGVSCCALIRLYYSAIILEKPIPLRECWAFVNRIKGPLVLMLLLFVVLLTMFIVADFLLLFIGIITSAALFGLLGTLIGTAQNPVLTIMIIFFMILWGFVVLGLLITLVTVQGFFFVFPIVSLATANDPDIPWWRHILNAYRLIFVSLPRLMLFAMALFGFSLVVSLTMSAPALVWSWLEMARLGVSDQHHVPLYINTVLNLWRSVVDLLLIPFYVSAATLFWYDCRVRKEGLDLQIWFAGILRRRGKEPHAYQVQPGF